MPRKPTRRGIRRHAARHRSGGTVYMSDEEFVAALDVQIADLDSGATPCDAGADDDTGSSDDSGGDTSLDTVSFDGGSSASDGGSVSSCE